MYVCMFWFSLRGYNGLVDRPGSEGCCRWAKWRREVFVRLDGTGSLGGWVLGRSGQRLCWM